MKPKEQYKQLMDEISDGEMPDDWQERAGAFMRSDTPYGFALFFFLAHDFRLTKFAFEWIELVYSAHSADMGVVIKAFRGAAKTTVFTTFAAYWLGNHPTLSLMLVQVGQEIAANNSSKIATLIEYNPAWQIAFPHVFPDIPAGWGASGYEIAVDKIWVNGEWADINYEEFRRQRGKDPSFVGLGYKSRAIIGSRVDFLLVDDINDGNNTMSAKELAKVNQITIAVLLPTLTPGAFEVYVGTPWVENDVLDERIKTGLYWTVETPIIDANGKPTWPSRFPDKAIKKLRIKWGEIEFARMGLLDIKAAMGRNLKGEWWDPRFPYEEIDPSWPDAAGWDYASSRTRAKDGTDPDLSAQANGKIHPSGFVIVTDGWFGHTSQHDGHVRLSAWASVRGENVKTLGIEAIGTGKEFYETFIVHDELLAPKVLPISHGKTSKPERLELILGAAVQKGVVRFSSAQTPFLIEAWKQWIGWGLVAHDDVLDSIYMLFKACEPWLRPQAPVPVPVANTTHSQLVEELLGHNLVTEANPFSAFGDA